MNFENVNEINLPYLSQSDCQKYLLYLRESLIKAREKVSLNQLRRTIYKVEDRLRKLKQTR